MKKLFLIMSSLILCCFMNFNVYGAELEGSFSLSNGGSVDSLTDDSHYTTVTFNQNDTISIISNDGSAISGVYITWDSPVEAWTLTTDSDSLSCGANAFLHEYVALNTPSSQITINIPGDGMRISGIRIFSEGELPHDVQVWENSCDKADIMIIVAHADDEILFFGGILPTYAYTYDANIQVVYMTQFWNGQKVREHEKLDGLWESGIKYYPVSAPFNDYKSEDIETAATQYDYNAMVEYIVEQLRIFTPQVVVTHDINGEYGHGYHMLTCKAVQEAVTSAADSSLFTESATLLGTWDTPKTYIHLYKENAITLDYRIPLDEDYADRTALDIATEAYTKHVSQQQWWFYVSDTYVYSCADFGLWRTLVGADTTNDLLCNLKTYKVQEEEARLKAEEESRKAEEASREQASIEAASREQSSKEQASKEQISKELISLKQEINAQKSLNEASQKELKNQKLITTIAVIITLITIIIGIVILIKNRTSKS